MGIAERLNFTKKALEELSPAAAGKHDYYHDANGPQSVKGLLLIVTSSGVKTFQVYRKMSNKPVRVTLGHFPDITIEQARKSARAALSKLADGVNPNLEKKAARARSVTLGEVFEDYLQDRKTLKPRTVADYNQLMEKAFKDWQRKPLAEITRDMVAALHRKLGKHSETRANLAMRFLRALFNFAAGEYEDEQGASLFPDNPVTRISHKRAWYDVERRRTFIKEHQLRPWREAVMGLTSEHSGEQAETARDYLLLLLFTGLRRGEGARMEWSHVDLDGRTLTVPDTKNHDPHTLPLSDFLHDLLSRRREAHADLIRDWGDQDVLADRFVFPSQTSKSGYVNTVHKQMQKVTARSGVAFTLHDLRRTFVTTAERLDISAYAIKRLVNHRMRHDVTAGYIGYDVERLRKPMQAVTDFFLSAMDLRPSAAVVPLPLPSQSQADA